jgi:hypothetical protein
MADEPQDIPEPQAVAAEQLDDDFDWEQFFTNDETPAPVIATTEPEHIPPPEDDDLRAQLKQAQETSAKALEMATQAQTQGKMQSAITAWKAQASPAELQLADLLLDSASPEELQKNAQIVKTAALKLDATVTERLKGMEAKMQRDFGLPVPPTFQPMPDEEKVNQLLKEGSLEDAAATMMKGF